MSSEHKGEREMFVYSLRDTNTLTQQITLQVRIIKLYNG